MNKKQIYLDFAAASPLDERVLAAMQPYFSQYFYNPSAPYQPAREVKDAIESARHNVAKLIGARPSEVIFTAGATESINLALSITGHCVTLATEHASVLETLKQRGHNHTILPVDERGRVRAGELQTALQQDTTLVSLALVNNETGTLQDLKTVRQIVKDERKRRQLTDNPHPIYLHIDASQAAGYVDLHVARLGVDMMTLNGGKIYGPKQSAILYADSSVHLTPFIVGGGQERGLRAGTENVAGIIGFATALALAEKARKTETKRLEDIRNYLQKTLEDAFGDIHIIGDQKHRAPHILTVALPGLDAERALFRLESENILVATGSACAANKDTRSHVLTALGIESELIDGSLRFSFGRSTTREDIEYAVKIIVMVIKEERARGRKE